MSDLKIIFKNENGSCGIITPTPESLKTMSIEEIAAKSVPEGKSYRITDIDHIPSDKTFRDAWTDDNPTDTVDIDMTKAIEIHKNRLRALRKPILNFLDIEYQRADEMADFNKKQEIAQKKQALRDVTIQNWPSEPEALKDFIPIIIDSINI